MRGQIRRPSHATLVAYLGLFVALGGTGAYAANTIGSGDVINESLLSEDIKNGEVRNPDLRSGSVSSRVAANGSLAGVDVQDNALTGADVLESSLAKVPDANKLDGIDSTGLVQGRGELLSNRIVRTPGAPIADLLVVPGLGTFRAICDSNVAFVQYQNTTGGPIDVWHSVTLDKMTGEVVPDGDVVQVAVAGPVYTNLADGSTVSLGVGNDPGQRRVGTFHVFAFQSAQNAPCGFQVQGTLWVSP